MRIFLTLLLALLLSGCAGLDALKDAYTGLIEYVGGKDNAEPPHVLAEGFESLVPTRTLWSVELGNGSNEQYVNLVAAADETSVYAAERQGDLHAFKRLTGEPAWTQETGLEFSAGPALGDDKLILGTSNAEVVAYSTSDGSLLWKTVVSSEILAPPRVADGVVVVRGTDGHLTGLDEKTGATLWNYERPVPALMVRSRGASIVTNEFVIDGFASGKVIALSLDKGKLEWETTVALPHGRSEVDRLVDMDAAPVIQNGTLYISGYQGGVAAMSVREGEVQWREEKISTYTGLVANRRSLFLSDINSDVWSLDSRNGGDLWKQDELHQRRLTIPAMIKDYLVVGDFEGYLHILSQDDGGLLARVQVDDTPIDEAPLVYDDVIYVYSSGGKLSALTVD
ncbi:outer membrane protein assembly factor BamB [Candidatus Methylospira mobilis]|uniref:Outer membrane protein assembly factor BamB n=1 Tax=Candidatus Methylospira mobilis TaxID=1808979 RepID=A0A5Q0BKK5_9GAMM|nr:outer membrane protein assembly factor BamB [Candidatus Methylospira mobilis]QFY44109.1 outer membrane protein assembly factor BamB [Candidatus Methylospira mobilis]WNV06482.1 outer membrane protein assembly factor BamB [Candidatus Methylospira mobilis]